VLQETADGLLLYARISPKSAADRLGPLHDGRLKIAVTAAPDKGKANAHLLKFLARNSARRKARWRSSPARPTATRPSACGACRPHKFATSSTFKV